MSDPVNLRERFGDRYRISYDPAREGRDPDPWLQTIPCRGGITIYPFGGTTLAVEVDYHCHVSKALRDMGLRVHQEGDREHTFLFDVADFDRVAAVVKPHRRRQWTEAARQAARERLAVNLANAE